MAIETLRDLLALNTRLYLNCLDDLSDDVAGKRITDTTNSIVFLACHLVEARCFLSEQVGTPLPNPFAALLKQARSIDDIRAYPPLEEIRRAWTEIAAMLDTVLRDVDDEDLREDSQQRFPVGDPSVLGGVAFLVQHESYHIGQMAMRRKAFGLAAMRYAEEKPAPARRLSGAEAVVG